MDPVLFTETGHRVGRLFLDYWNSHGGLSQQGFPISDEFMEKNDLDGNIYRVQYFERAVFEYHPENAKPYDVLLIPAGQIPARCSIYSLCPRRERHTGYRPFFRARALSIDVRAESRARPGRVDI